MAEQRKKKLRNLTIVYWVLLIYIIAALLWWALSLIQQNNEIYNLQKSKIPFAVESQDYRQELEAIEEEHQRSNAKYIYEGATFLLLILVGAVFVYRAVRRQFRVQLQQQNFIMAVTHELKTPIAVSRLNLETLQRHNLDESRKEKLVQVTLQETMRLDTLINNILLASQLDGSSYKMAKEEIDLSQLVTHMLQQFATRYPDRPVQGTVAEDLEISGDTTLLRLLVSNLLENAHKYSPKGKPILVSLEKSGRSIRFTVADEGVGIEDEEKELIFKKFYRVGNEETRKAQGTGLGLYLCKKIAEDHRGHIQVADNQPQGSKFIVEFSL